MILSNNKKTALAVFVKTPGLSNVKTRLGQSIGAHKAKDFYKLSVDKIRNELKLLQSTKVGSNVDVYWSLAEKFNPLHALMWDDFKRIHQEGSSLGEKISSVYNSLIDQGYDRVILLGGDSPQLTYKDYEKWITAPLLNKEVLIGPAEDGGFYTFVGKDKISLELWNSVAYSSSRTVLELSEALMQSNFRIEYLPESFDVDYVEDLTKLNSTIKNEKSVQSKKLSSFIESVTA